MVRACTALLGESGYERGRPDVARLLDLLGVVVRDQAHHGGEGLSVEGDSYVVTVDGSFGSRHRLFSIAHEVGHILLFEGLLEQGDEALEMVARDHGNRAVEQLCNRAASELLMPADDFRSRLARSPLTLGTLRALADFYGVSFIVVLTRLTEVLTGMGVALLRNDPLTSGRSQAYQVIDELPGDRRLLGSSLLAASIRPNLLARCGELAEPAKSAALRIVLPGYLPLRRRGLAIRVRSNKRELPIIRTVNRRPVVMPVDYVLILQEPAAPAEEWTKLTRRPPRAQQEVQTRVPDA